MTMSVHVKLPEVALPELPPGGMRYVLAREGAYLERRTPMYATCVRTHGPLPPLPPHRESCTLYLPKLPRAMVRVMLSFFMAAYELHEGEAALVLLYHPAGRRFRWHCPLQTVEVYRSFGRLRAYDSITYEMPLELPAGYVICGDAHSHGDLQSQPSGMDHRDETYKDGLHIIVGQLGRNRLPQYHVDFVMDGQRFRFAPQQILEDPSCEPFPAAPESWMKRIVMKQYSSWSSSSSKSSSGYSSH